MEVITGRKRSLESQTLDLLLLLDSLGVINVCLTCLKPYLNIFMEVINGHCRSLEVQTLDLLLPLYSLVPSFHLKYILWLKNFNLEVIKGC